MGVVCVRARGSEAHLLLQRQQQVIEEERDVRAKLGNATAAHRQSGHEEGGGQHPIISNFTPWLPAAGKINWLSSSLSRATNRKERNGRDVEVRSKGKSNKPGRRRNRTKAFAYTHELFGFTRVRIFVPCTRSCFPFTEREREICSLGNAPGSTALMDCSRL